MSAAQPIEVDTPGSLLLSADCVTINEETPTIDLDTNPIRNETVICTSETTQEQQQLHQEQEQQQQQQQDGYSLRTRRARPLVTRGKQRRRHKLQTDDLIREVSPQPDEFDAIQTVEGVENALTGDKDSQQSITLGTLQPSDIDKTVRESTGQTTKTSVATMNGKRTVKCNICQRQMTESRLANHIRLMHSESNQKNDENSTGKAKEFRCEYCGRSYAIKYTFEQHLRTHKEGRPKCPDCGATFASAFSLFRHRAKTHNMEHNYTTHTCNQCDKVFFSSSELALHQQRHSKKKDHECPECKKAFAAKGNLRIHMRTHAKEKLYKCDICDSSFSHPYSLVTHRRIHTNEYPFKCEECGKSYRSKHQLTSHTNVHSDNRPFTCDQCPKTFRSRTAFNMHQDEHKGIKRFACKYCGRKFQCHANKSKHERRHAGVKRFKCDSCDKAFIEKQELKNHQKVHEKQSSTDTNNANNQTKSAKSAKVESDTPIDVQEDASHPTKHDI